MNDDVHISTWGTADTRALLVHGSLATGADAWPAQAPLAELARLAVIDRRGYGASPPLAGEDYLLDAADITAVVDRVGGADGMHLVGHSYGGVGLMLAAAERPASTRSLALLEPAVFSLAPDSGPARGLVDDLRAMWDRELSDGDWAAEFLRVVGTDPAVLPDEVIDELAALVPVLRNARPPWDAELPIAELASTPSPKLVISGGHHPGYEELCDVLAAAIGAERAVVAGAGHEVQLTGEPLNSLLAGLWERPIGGVR